MDLTISYDKEDVVKGFVLTSSYALRHCVEHVREVSGSAQRYAWQILPINVLDACRADDFRVHEVSIEGETVLHLVASHVAGDTAEAIHWEALIVIVDFKDRTHRRYSLLILVEALEEMQRGWQGGLPIRGSEVYCHV